MLEETIACVVYVPVDVVKERMQVQSRTNALYQNSLNAPIVVLVLCYSKLGSTKGTPTNMSTKYQSYTHSLLLAICNVKSNLIVCLYRPAVEILTLGIHQSSALVVGMESYKSVLVVAVCGVEKSDL
jgi:hypothetical protein